MTPTDPIAELRKEHRRLTANHPPERLDRCPICALIGLIDAQQRRIEELERDSARLDWLDGRRSGGAMEAQHATDDDET
jgi:hypothetical protein